MIWLMISLASAQQCTQEAMYTHLEQAEQAFREMRSTDFREEKERALQEFSCVSEILLEENLIKLYRVLLLSSFTERDMSLFGGYARAIHSLDPKASLLKDLVHEAHPMRNLAEFATEQGSKATKEIPMALYGPVYVDGFLAEQIPIDRPFTWQETTEAASVSSPRLIVDYQELPEYELALSEQYWKIELNPRRVLVAGSIASVAMASASMAYYTERRFWDPSTSSTDAAQLRRQNNIWAGTTVGLGLASVGLFVGSVVIGTW